jgi:hypothetical protein
MALQLAFCNAAAFAQLLPGTLFDPARTPTSFFASPALIG